MSTKSKESTQTVSRTGYSSVDLAAFLARGNQAAANTKQEKLKKKTGHTVIDKYSESSFLGKPKEIIERTHSGFQGALTSMSDSEVDRLMNVFAQRRNYLTAKKAKAKIG